jgi:hypothetical protein
MSKFGDAFAAARKAGKEEFTFNGKKYHTRTKDEEMAAKTARLNPSQSSGPAIPNKDRKPSADDITNARAREYARKDAARNASMKR